MTSWTDLPLIPEHVDLLTEQAITPEIAHQRGVRSITTLDDMPGEFAGYGDNALPGLLFPWTEPDGTTTPQLKVPDGKIIIDGRPAKYLWPKGRAAALGVIRDVPAAAKAILVEGTKQGLAAAAWAPAEYAVYAIGGIRMWSRAGVPTHHLDVFEGVEVYVFPDADTATNLDVYTASEKLAEELELAGADAVWFPRTGGGAKAGLDDILGGRKPEQRTAFLARAIDRVTKLARGLGKKPADAKPKPKKGSGKKDLVPLSAERGRIVVNDDRYEVINNLTGALVDRWDRQRLFNYGGVIGARTGVTMAPIDRRAFLDIIQETTQTVSRMLTSEGEVEDTFAWPDNNTVDASLSRAGSFAPLDRLGKVPFVRPDGTICAASGYDEGTRSFLVLDEALEDLDVPEEPTPEQVKAAVSLYLNDLLVDFPFPTDADRANALATLLTPFIRALVPISPLAIVDGKEAGSGKNLFADLMAIVFEGKAITPLPYSTDDAEQRKVITAAFRSGQSLFVFDEAHKIEGPSFARALTSITYQDRILGGSVMAEFPNNVTWVSLGNNVEVLGDMSRRAYRVRMSYAGASPEMRSGFKHDDIRGWATEHRADLIRAALVMVRSWFAAGRPIGAVPYRMGSFETWQKVIAGVLTHAGVEGFLVGMKEWRSESDFTRQHWTEFLAWVGENMRGREFTVGQLTVKINGGADVPLPVDIQDPAAPGYNRVLGMALRKHLVDRVLDGLTLVKLDKKGHGSAAIYRVDEVPAEGGGGGESGDTLPTQPHRDFSSLSPTHDVTCVTRVGAEQEPSLRSLPLSLTDLLSAATGPEPTKCRECQTQKVHFGSAGILTACPQCHPETVSPRRAV